MSTLGELFDSGLLSVLWCTALAGWGLVAAALWRGLTGQARKASLFAHVLTLGAIVLGSTVVGYGLLDTVIAATAGWWALLVVTRFRPERLLDPHEGGALVCLAAWSAAAGAVGFAIHQSLF